MKGKTAFRLAIVLLVALTITVSQVSAGPVQSDLYKEFVAATAEIYMDLVRDTQKQIKTDVYIFDAVGYFAECPFANLKTIRFKLKHGRVAMLNMAAQELCQSSVDQFKKLFKELSKEVHVDDIGVYVKYEDDVVDSFDPQTI